MNDELYHHGVKGQKWGVRRYQNKDGSLIKKSSVVKKMNRLRNLSEKRKNRIMKRLKKVGKNYVDLNKTMNMTVSDLNRFNRAMLNNVNKINFRNMQQMNNFNNLNNRNNMHFQNTMNFNSQMHFHNGF